VEEEEDLKEKKGERPALKRKGLGFFSLPQEERGVVHGKSLPPGKKKGRAFGGDGKGNLPQG